MNKTSTFVIIAILAALGVLLFMPGIDLSSLPSFPQAVSTVAPNGTKESLPDLLKKEEEKKKAEEKDSENEPSFAEVFPDAINEAKQK